ncbi:MAG TPA: helix-turn-helix domain-containing protein [Ilumatobacteraceae bacterium]|nr:helix-turn-helix domain-containing protein [Ilumatobacteraceae bacterium]
MGLFATFPVDDVTVHDIAGAVGMTPAAVYYHFASKEQILLEGMERFTKLMLQELRDNMPAKGDAAGIPSMMSHMLAWVRRNRSYATVYFVNSIGLNLVVEALRRATRIELVDLFKNAVKTVRGRTRAAEAAVIAVALVSLFETATASNLSQDPVYRGLGSRRFPEEVEVIAARLVRSS